MRCPEIKKCRSLAALGMTTLFGAGDGFQPSRKCVLKGDRSAEALRHAKSVSELCSAWTDRSVRPHTGKSKVKGGERECPAPHGLLQIPKIKRVVAK